MQTVIPPPVIQHPDYLRHYKWMCRAIALADAAGSAGEVPVGAVVVDGENNLIAEAENRKERDHDPTAHAEVLALREAGRSLQQWRLQHCTLYITLEPCPMCAGAIIQSRITTVVYGADDPKTGSLRTVVNIPDAPCSNHPLTVVSGILANTCATQLQTWFAAQRSKPQSSVP
ncbi:MAG: tRNA adenosine(34) deaminase TadA [Leptolyngbyaceae bacterium]|nr:tRNA adenosine(34) deaminase TadA [Leptolyngbyaceae bacterium]